MRGWLLLYGVLGTGSMSAIGMGVQSHGIVALGVLSFFLAGLSVLSGTVRGRG